MKKLTHLLIALSAIVLSSFTLFAGCGNKDNSTPVTSSENNESTPVISSEENVSESVEDGPAIDGWDDI